MSAVDGVALGPGLGRHMDEVAQVQRMRPCCCFTTSHNISKVRSALPAKRSVQKRAFFFILPILRRCRAFAGSSKTLAKVLAPGPNRWRVQSSPLLARFFGQLLHVFSVKNHSWQGWCCQQQFATSHTNVLGHLTQQQLATNPYSALCSQTVQLKNGWRELSQNSGPGWQHRTECGVSGLGLQRLATQQCASCWQTCSFQRGVFGQCSVFKTKPETSIQGGAANVSDLATPGGRFQLVVAEGFLLALPMKMATFDMAIFVSSHLDVVVVVVLRPAQAMKMPTLDVANLKSHLEVVAVLQSAQAMKMPTLDVANLKSHLEVVAVLRPAQALQMPTLDVANLKSHLEVVAVLRPAQAMRMPTLDVENLVSSDLEEVVVVVLWSAQAMGMAALDVANLVSSDLEEVVVVVLRSAQAMGMAALDVANFCVFPLGGGGNTSVGTGNEDANSWCGKFCIFPLGVGGGASAGTDTWCGKFGVALGGGGNASVSQALRCQHLMQIWSLPTWRWWWSIGRHGQWRWHNLRMRVGSSSVGGASAKGVNESVVVWSSIKLCNPASRSTSLAVSTESEHFRSHQLRHVRIRRCCQHRWA